RHFRRQGRAEERELKPEAPALCRLQVSRVVPPLGAELGMRPMIGGEMELPRLDRLGIARVVRAAKGVGDGERGLGIEERLGAEEEVEGKRRGDSGHAPPYPPSNPFHAGRLRTFSLRKVGSRKWSCRERS